MSLFSSLKDYPGSWSAKEQQSITPEEADEISSAKVEEGTYGLRVRFDMKNNRVKVISLSALNTTLKVGDVLDPLSIVTIVLCREGDQDIYRVDGKKK